MRWATTTLLTLLLAACSHDNGHPLSPPFDDRTVLGSVSAVWTETSDQRGFAEGDRLQQPQVRLQYRVDVRNRTNQKVFIRLGNFQLVDAQGLPLGADQASIECDLPDGQLNGVLRGDVWLPIDARRKVSGFRIASLAIPLDDKGRDKYRAWQLQGRPDAGAEIDKEIARLAAAPTCSGQ